MLYNEEMDNQRNASVLSSQGKYQETTGLTNSRQLKMKKRAGSTPPESAKVICNKENFLVFAKPKLPSTSRNSMPARLRKQSPAVHLSSLKLPLKNVQNIPKSHIPIRVNHVPGSPRRTLQMPYKHDCCKMRADRRRSQSLRMIPYSIPSKSKTG